MKMKIFCVYTDIPANKLSGEFIHWTLISDINYRDGKIICHKSFLPDRQLSHLHQFIGWTGSRPSEALKLQWKDVDFGRRNYTKRDTKSGQTLLQPMSEKVREVLLQQRVLLNNSSAELQESS